MTSTGKLVLPCAGCSTNSSSLYFWETMNLCSEKCLTDVQLSVSSKCSTCSKKLTSINLGKLSVRFGNDIKTFCSGTCLEALRSAARVCFNCQLDVKKLPNVILINMPSPSANEKANSVSTPREFCSQDCVEMYLENIMMQKVANKQSDQLTPCHTCCLVKPFFRELVIITGSMKVCSPQCWDKLLDNGRLFRKVEKCTMCSKFVNLDITPRNGMGFGLVNRAFFVSKPEKTYGFCSAKCKNLFVTKDRKIVKCSTCQVKKYHYDLIKFNGIRKAKGGGYAMEPFEVCSVNCIPNPSEFIKSIKKSLNQSTTDSELIGKTKFPKKQKQKSATSNSNVVPTTDVQILKAITHIDSTNASTSQSSRPSSSKSNSSSSSLPKEVDTKNVSSTSTSTSTETQLPERLQHLLTKKRKSDTSTTSDSSTSTEGDHLRVEYITEEEMNQLVETADALVFAPRKLIEVKNKSCLVKPKIFTKSTQMNTNVKPVVSSKETQADISIKPTITTKDSSCQCTLPVEDKQDKIYVPLPFQFGTPQPTFFPIPVPVYIPVPIPIFQMTKPYGMIHTLSSTSQSSSSQADFGCSGVMDLTSNTKKKSKKDKKAKPSQQQQPKKRKKKESSAEDLSSKIPRRRRISDSLNFIQNALLERQKGHDSSPSRIGTSSRQDVAHESIHQVVAESMRIPDLDNANSNDCEVDSMLSESDSSHLQLDYQCEDFSDSD